MTKTVDEPIVLTDEQREQFLQKLAENPGVGHVRTLREIGVEGKRGRLREVIDTQLRADIDQVRNDSIRQELARRGITGVVEDVWHNGEKVGERVVYSDRCLVALAGMRLPEARNQLDVNLAGADGGPVRVEVAGERVSTIAGVFALAARLGVAGADGGVIDAAPRGALPAASDVLPDPPDDQ